MDMGAYLDNPSQNYPTLDIWMRLLADDRGVMWVCNPHSVGLTKTSGQSESMLQIYSIMDMGTYLDPPPKITRP